MHFYLNANSVGVLKFFLIIWEKANTCDRNLSERNDFSSSLENS